MVTIYFGEYTVTSYSGNALLGGKYTAAATNGCFTLILEQPPGGVAGQSQRRVALAVGPTPTPNAFGDGEPNEPLTEEETVVDVGSIASLTINNLTPTTGSGSFSFTNSALATATGTVTITGSTTTTIQSVKRSRIEALRARRMRLRTH
jgi:hypothetical protein